MNKDNIKSKSLTKGSTFFETIIIILIIFFILWLFLPKPRQRPQAKHIACQQNMKSLSLAIVSYANEHSDTYPTPKKWCDLIEPFLGDKAEKIFRCPALDEGKCHYAMNPDCEPNSPGDVVLLFETKGGWNLFGGSEILSIDNHTKKGCNVLFNNYHVEFITEDKIGDLMWSDEEPNE